MSRAGALTTLLIVAFWLTMNGLVLRRELETRDLGRYERGVTAFLGTAVRRERWLSIYKEQGDLRRKVGYSGFTVEKEFADSGIEYHLSLETVFRGRMPLESLLPGKESKGSRIDLGGRLVLDRNMRPERLQVDIVLRLLEGTPLESRHHFFVSGRARGDRFRLELRRGEERLLALPIPRASFAISDGLSPALPLAGCRVGDRFRVPVLDPFSPLTLGTSTATILVTGRRVAEIHGIRMDVYELQTEFHGTKSRSIVTSAGEIVRQELGPPLDLVLRREKSRARARIGLEP